MKNFVTTLLAGSFTLSISTAALADPATRDFNNIHGVPLPSVALVDDTTALPLNPGAAGAKDLFEVYLSKSLDPGVQGQFNVFAGFPNFSLGYQQFDTNNLGDLRKFYVGYTYPVNDFFSLGANYHLTQQVSQENSNIHAFDVGALLRPTRFLSLGMSVRNLNTPAIGNEIIRRSYVTGVGLRPFGETLTLTADAQWDEGDDVKDITALFGVEAEPIQGLLLRSSVDLKGQFMFGAGFQFELFNTGYFHSFNGPQNRDAFHFQLTNAVFESAVKQIGNSFAYVDLSGGVRTDSGEPTLGIFENGGGISQWNLIKQLKMIKELPRYKGAIIELGALGVGLGSVEEIKAAVEDLQKSGKKVVFYLKDAGLREFYLAAQGDKILMHPMGSLRLKGFSYVLPHYKNLLDKVGVEVEFIKVGKYKTGLESYTLNEASDPTKEQYKSIQDNDFSRLMGSLKSNRSLKEGQIERILNKTLFNAEEAKQIGLIDQIGYQDELDEIAANLIHQPKVGVDDIRRLRVHDESWEPKDKIAVIYLNGSIVEGRSGSDFLFGEQFVGSQTIMEEIFEAREDESVKALVVRVNSPGGSALASDEIYRALQRFKAVTNKPVIISMGDIAASGGYWVAMAGDKVLANPSTLTGSIGIYAGKTNFEKLYQKLGVNHTVIKTNPKADAEGDHRSYTDEEAQIIQNHLQDYYRIFLKRVSENRKLDMNQVAELAQGRVYTGDQAHQKKLVDELGSLGDAIQLARKMADIKTTEVQVLHLPKDDLVTLPAQTAQAKSLWDATKKSALRLFPNGVSILALTPEYPHLGALE